MRREKPIRAARFVAATAVMTGALVAAAGPSSHGHAQLTDSERAMAAYLEEHREDAIALLERLVNQNSGTLNHEGVRAAYEILAPEFEALGFEVRWVELPDSTNRAGHLVAVREGDGGGKRLLLIGHLDTVFEEGDAFQTFTRQGETATGPGVSDMKGGDVAILYALKAMNEVGALDGATIRVVMTGDEESPGKPLSVARAALIEAAQQSDVALGFEGGSRAIDFEYGVIARRSSTGWFLEVEGIQAHSSGIFSEGTGAGAIFEAARILNAFYSYVRGEEFLTFNAGSILGGTDVEYDLEETRGTVFGKTNVVPRRVTVHGGVRTISNEQLERTRERMREIVETGNLPGTSARITFFEGYPAMPPTAANEELLDTFEQVSVDLGLGPIEPFDPGARGAADVSFVAGIVEAAMDGLGVHGRGSHTPNESMDLGSFVAQMQKAAVLMKRLAGG